MIRFFFVVLLICSVSAFAQKKAIVQPDGSVQIVPLSPLEVSVNLCRQHIKRDLSFPPGYDGKNSRDANCPEVMRQWGAFLATQPLVDPNNPPTSSPPNAAAINGAIGQ